MNRFLGACGATGPLKLIAEGPESDDLVRAVVDQPFALIGSGVHADLRLDDEQVSHRHLYLQVYDGRVFAFDLGSRTGTHWDEERQPHGWLDAGQAIRVGKYRIRLDEEGLPEKRPSDDLSSEPLISRAFENPLLPSVGLEFIKGGIQEGDVLKPARCPIRRTLVFLGRTDKCKVRLMHSSVSKFHCSLIRTPRGVWVVDLLSRNGVWINGTKVPWSRLEEGDRFEVGEFVLRLRYERPDPDQESRKAAVFISESPGIGEGEKGRRGEGEKEDGGGSRTDDQGSMIGASVADPQSSILDSPSSVDVQSLSEDAESNGRTMVVSSGRAPSPFPLSPGGRGQGEGALVPAELSESIALIISNQFAELQRQMFDQFQQAMMVMFQTFSLLHRDQMELVRQELNRVHELTRQLHELQAELAKQPASAKDPEMQRLLGNAQKTAAAPAADVAAAFNPEDWNEAFLKAAQKVMAANAASEAPAAEEPAVFSLPPEPALQSAAKEASAAAQECVEEPVARQQERQPVDSPQSSTAAPPSQAADIHALLCQKIAVLQAERQSRWQKIIQFLAGKKSGQPVP